ncbi:MAG: deoxyguanosinetriphosphate triphosphohydrolase [Candidatus Saelkia tenebricola]|nr:deoxyguanosinetriphosphate triphosphohydrolase [Candidatus Saelkia tenebricola]
MNRQEYQNFEQNFLAPYALKSIVSAGRRYKEDEHEFRTCFQRDRDRIIHSTAFRRLEYKTQVFVIHEGDYYRTRLTHSLEVAQIARSIARVLGLNADLVEAIALGHDVGHTPFGHSGEELLRDLMGSEGFDHNLQGLRVVDCLEKRYPDFCGLNLTYEVREGLIKHSTRYDDVCSEKTGLLPSKYGNLDLAEFNNSMQPTLEAQVVDVADEIAYDNHDLDDGITSGLISEEDLKKIPLWSEAEYLVDNKYPVLSAEFKKHQIIRILIDMDVKDVITFSLQNLKSINSVKDVKSASFRLIAFSKQMQEKRRPLRDFLLSELYHHHRVIRMSDKAKRIIKDLFTVYMNKPAQLPAKIQQNIVQEGLKRTICDYIASMTDSFAQNEYKMLFDPLERV